MEKSTSTFRNYLRENGWEMLSGLVISVIGFFLALYIDSLREHRLELETFHSLVEAVQQEADYNKDVLVHSFEPYFDTAYVAATLSLSTVKAALANSLFVHHSDKAFLHCLNEYTRVVDLCNGFAYTTLSIRTMENGVDYRMIDAWRANIEDCKRMIEEVESMHMEPGEE